MNLLKSILNSLELFFGLYSFLYLSIYSILLYLSVKATIKHFREKKELNEKVLTLTDESTGVSIIAPAFNEEQTIIESVKSFFSQIYSKYEVVIINDGSTDNTLGLLIDEFDLVKVDFYYIEKIPTQPVRGHYKSTNPLYSKLLVVDKENGKSKADASNAGINSCKYSIFICTDVDCILRADTIAMMVKPFVISKKRVIASGATIRMANQSDVKDGNLVQHHYPDNFYAGFQELEYLRSFIFGRMAFSSFNGLLLVSGGLGMFDKDIFFAAGGYWHKSLGEDLDLVIRMRKHMHETNQPFEISYIPETLCWTEGPSTKDVFLRQRSRWARGLVQTLNLHKKIFFNPAYGVTGMVSFPYFVFYEMLVPVMELIGIIVLLLDLIFFDINYKFFVVITFFVYLYYVALNLANILTDQLTKKQYPSLKQVFVMIKNVFLEPFLYHPINLYASLKGQWQFFRNEEQKWGVMTRQGFNKKTN